jgi:hypothetical protein
MSPGQQLASIISFPRLLSSISDASFFFLMMRAVLDFSSPLIDLFC